MKEQELLDLYRRLNKSNRFIVLAYVRLKRALRSAKIKALKPEPASPVYVMTPDGIIQERRRHTRYLLPRRKYHWAGE